MLDLSKYSALIEEVLDMNSVDSMEFLIKPDFDEDLADIRERMGQMEREHYCPNKGRRVKPSARTCARMREQPIYGLGSHFERPSGTATRPSYHFKCEVALLLQIPRCSNPGKWKAPPSMGELPTLARFVKDTSV